MVIRQEDSRTHIHNRFSDEKVKVRTPGRRWQAGRQVPALLKGSFRGLRARGGFEVEATW